MLVSVNIAYRTLEKCRERNKTKLILTCFLKTSFFELRKKYMSLELFEFQEQFD